MLRKYAPLLLFSAGLLLIYVLVSGIEYVLAARSSVYGWYNLVNWAKILLFLAWIVGLFYRRTFQPMFRNKPVIFLAGLLLISVPLTYGKSLFDRGRIAYNFFKVKSTVGAKVHRAHPELGLVSVPHSYGKNKFANGKTIHVKYDDAGFRIPHVAPYAHAPEKPLILFLGDSYTFGDKCNAEEAFPWLTGQRLDRYTINAGIGSYGLAQMLIRARKLIKAYRPEFVVVQYSPWLAQRSVRIYTQSRYARIPVPYFVREKDIRLRPPLFDPPVYGLRQWMPPDHGFWPKAKFIWQAGIPVFWREDLLHWKAQWQELSGSVSAPYTSGIREIEKHVYGEIAGICRKLNSRLIILPVSTITLPIDRDRVKLLAKGANIADADSVLWSLGKDEDHYARLFCHWQTRGEDSVLVDYHPNPYAHKIIAQEISRVILQDPSHFTE